MSVLSKTVETDLERARKVKEISVRNGEDVINPVISLYRGEEPVALIMCMEHVRDTILHAAGMGIQGYGADVATLIFEGWATESETNPLTGEHWREGEMQDVAHNHDGLAKGWVMDALTAMGGNRAGDICLADQRFRVQKKRVEWLISRSRSNERDGDDESAGGNMVEYLIKIMNEPSVEQRAHLAQIMPPLPPDTSHEARRAYVDAAVTRIMMKSLPVVTMLNPGEPGSERHEMLSTELPGSRMV